MIIDPIGKRCVDSLLKNSSKKIVLITWVIAKPSKPSIKLTALTTTKNTNTVVIWARSHGTS